MTMSCSSIFPGFDYIGSSACDGLRMSLPSESRAVRISLGCMLPEILNLKSVRLLDARQGRLDLSADEFVVSTSTSFNDDDGCYGAASVRAGNPLHTKRELHPWLEIKWDSSVPRFVDICNRPDEFGLRSASLCVSALVGSEWKTLYEHNGVDRALRLLASVAHHLSPSDLWNVAHGRYEGVRDRAIDSILSHAGRDSWRGLDSRMLLALTNVYAAGEWRDVAMLSLYFASELAGGSRITQLSPARNILFDSKRIVDSEIQVNRFLEEWGEPAGYTYTRHGMHRSLLRSNSAMYLSLASAVMAALEGAGIKSFLCYGTLLGAMREGDFIAHDDDMDVVYVGSAADPSDRTELDMVLGHLRMAGFMVTPQEASLNVHVWMKEMPGITVDLFPTWTNGDLIYMYMEGMAIRGVDKNILMPLGVVKFLGQEFATPANPERFLVDRYGESWFISDRFYEWPYAVSK